MTLTLRYRILLTLLPLLVLVAGMGGAAVFILHHLGGSIDAILRDNIDSVLYMEHLNEALERIDSSFQFALAGREAKARGQYQANWPSYEENLRLEQGNITIEGEGELVARLTALTERYRRQGAAFYGRPARNPARHNDYFESGGLLDTFKELKDVSGQITTLNQDKMESTSQEAQRTARNALIGFAVGSAAAVLLAGWLALQTTQAILRPLRVMTQSAQAIGLGNLDQVVAVPSRDELGDLAEAFNRMARQLRLYRQSDYSRLLRAQRTGQATIDSFPDPVLVVGPQGHVEMANPAAQHTLGLVVERDPESAAVAWQPPEALRQPLAEALRDQRPYLPERFDQAFALRADGREHFFLPRILPIRDPYGNTQGAAVLLQDVTRFRLLDQVKGNLVATVSHELKTPLTSIRLAVHLLLEEAVGPLEPKQVELLLDARDNAERLLAMVNNLLDLGRLERGHGPLERRPISPAVLLREGAEAVGPRAEAKEVAVSVEAADDLPPLAGDPAQLQHALGNLLDNALTYTDRGGRITLSASPSNGAIVLAVADTGRGIPAEHLPHVFERFFRVPGQQPKSGTGLGLAIVREIVTAHGGTVTCDSQPGAGTVFRLTLPVASAAASREAPADQLSV
jgi:signal transduction histidine kinase